MTLSKFWQRNLILFAFITLLPSVLLAAPEKGQLLDRIVATVNDDIILKSELDRQVATTEKDLTARNVQITDIEQLKRKVLDKMIMEKLQLQRIKAHGIQVQDEEVLGQIQQIAKRNNLTVLELRDRLNLSEPDGFKHFRQRIRQQMLFQKLRQVEVLDQTQVTEDEINSYLQRQSLIQNNFEYHVGHIMVNLPDSATPEQRDKAKQKAEAILERLQDGEDFSQVAVRYSEGSKALNGGDLGWLTTDQIPTFFTNTVESLKVGQLSNIIHSPVGYHIIKLLGKRDKGSKLVEQYHLYRFILLSDNAKKQSNPPKALIELAKNIKSLEDFKKLNKKYSDIPASVNAHGNLGWQTTQQMPLEYAKAISDVPPKHAAIPFATEKGWVILFVDGKRLQDMNAAGKRKQAEETLRLKKANEAYEIWLRRLKDDAVININLGKQNDLDSEKMDDK
ncbi:peptidylprolyl isomerase [Hydrogenovibrio kuenenii]|uniref:peptidylprolyl isomerase n=1 Tax=Hydrogenovibrio kuenenii TaxID=63658 RepID=UPI000467C72B|nr:peptidylprolyl isomerase [Hydrogenovibrio kuenenii]